MIADKILVGLDETLVKEKPDLILVHGDTATCFISALTAFYHRIPVGHVEAGLRSGNINSPFPEEAHRILTGNIAALQFAPTKSNAENLYKTGVTENVYITGNTAIDAMLMLVKDDYKFKSAALKNIGLTGRRTIVMTAHRRENLGKPMENIFAAVKKIALEYSDTVQIIYPVHKNPAVTECADKILGGVDNIYLIEPLDVEDMQNLMNKCCFVMTDSGGLQEEAPSLGKPVLVFRTETERPEAVEAGTVKIVGVETNNIYKEARILLEDESAYSKMAKAVNPYGDGKASERIVAAIKEYFNMKA
jgi:UDP-N-acetylglucosamine 2-epimerase (non-hydrolysing)